MLRFWHVGHKVGGTLTPDAHAETEVTHAMAVLHQNGRSAAATGNVVGRLNATKSRRRWAGAATQNARAECMRATFPIESLRWVPRV